MNKRHDALGTGDDDPCGIPLKAYARYVRHRLLFLAGWHGRASEGIDVSTAAEVDEARKRRIRIPRSLRNYPSVDDIFSRMGVADGDVADDESIDAWHRDFLAEELRNAPEVTDEGPDLPLMF